MELLSLVLYLLLTIICFQTLLLLVTKTKSTRKLPPGPVPLPVIGDILKLGNRPHRSLAKLAQTHGPIMSLRLGQITTVVISSSNMAKQVLQKQDLLFSSRSPPNAIQAHDHPQYSVVWLPVADRWRSLRKIMNSNLFSGQRLDSNQFLRRRKVEELVDYAGKCCKEGVAVEIGRAAFATSLNLLSNTIFSLDLADLSEDSGKEFRDLVWNVLLDAAKPNLADYFPGLSKFDPQGIRARMTVYFGKIIDLFRKLIDERLEFRRLNKTKSDTDVIDILLNLSEDNNKKEIDRTHIERLCLDLFVAGTDTTSGTVEWAMAELLHNPETLKKAKFELEQTIGKGKIVEESDITRLPYLRAILKETWRMHPPVPFLIPRKVHTDVQVCGYVVPEGARVIVNAWAIGRDPSVWPNPTTFMPERFLDSDVDVRGQDFELIPFGAGRRICPGLPLAIRMVPVMLGSLINLFDWKLEGGVAPKDLNMEEKFGITLQKAQPLRVVPFHV